MLLGLGANLGAPLAQLAAALEALSAFVIDLRASSIYRTSPQEFPDQPDFFNLVCSGRTRLAPLELLAALLEIERSLGRVRSFRGAPRSIDIDLLAYDALIVDSAELTLPHPRLHQRRFVLVPLAEIEPEWRHPVLGSTALELLARAEPGGRVEPWPAPPRREEG